MEVEQVDSQSSSKSAKNHKFSFVRRIDIAPTVKTNFSHSEALGFIVPTNRKINQLIVPIIDQALNQRQQLLLEFKSKSKAAMQVEEKKRAEVKKMEEEIKILALDNERERKIISEMEAKLEKQRKMSEVSKQLEKLEKLRNAQCTIERQLKEIREEKSMYELLEEEMGVCYVGKVKNEEGDEDSGNYLITCTKIHPQFPEDPYHLYFSSFDFTRTGIRVSPVSADPTFPELETVKQDFKESTNLSTLVNLVRDYWKRDARVEGALRVATPRIKQQEKRVKGKGE